MRWAIDPCVPWKGCGPLEVADQTGSLDKALESWLANESSTPTGFLLPVPHVEQDEADDPLAPMKADLKTLAGGLALVETTAVGFGEGRDAAPQKDWIPSRLDRLHRRHCVRSGKTQISPDFRLAESLRSCSGIGPTGAQAGASGDAGPIAPVCLRSFEAGVGIRQSGQIRYGHRTSGGLGGPAARINPQTRT